MHALLFDWPYAGLTSPRPFRPGGRRLYRSPARRSDTIKAMVVILFRSRLTSQAGQDYQDLDAELEHLVLAQPGYLSHKGYQAADGERLTLVWFRDQESLRAWKMQPRHLEAQRRGRERWYEFYEMDVAEVIRSSHFKRSGETG
jgi:heme-degrading monooxygenase HmoA